MKIPDNLSGAGIGSTGLGGASGAERARGADALLPGGANRSGESAPDGDRVQLSGLGQALRIATEDTPERLSQINGLRQDYQTGRYQPDPQVVSAKIVNDALKSPFDGGSQGGAA